MFVAWNRLEFTKESLRTLVRNTDWSMVRRLIIHDDGSTDGTAEYLDSVVLDGPKQIVVYHGKEGSPTGVMNRYLRTDKLTFLAKIDNDAMMPPGWLNEGLAVMDSYPELDLLGLAAWMPPGEGQRNYEPGIIGGIGLLRASAFTCCLPWSGGRFGGGQMWQSDHRQEPIVLTGPERPENPPHRVAVTGWINPGIHLFLLDQMPLEPWVSLTREYIDKGWQRPWTTYPETDSHLWDWWLQTA